MTHFIVPAGDIHKASFENVLDTKLWRDILHYFFASLKITVFLGIGVICISKLF